MVFLCWKVWGSIFIFSDGDAVEPVEWSWKGEKGRIIAGVDVSSFKRNYFCSLAVPTSLPLA